MEEVSLIISFAFVLMIMVFLLKFTHINWKFKALFTIMSVGVVVAFCFGLRSILGWPIDLGMPKCVMLIEGVDIREPSESDPGIIYVWYIDVDEAIRTGKPQTPRSIYVPYNSKLLKNLNRAMGRLADGGDSYMKFNVNTGGTGQGEIDFVPPPNTRPQKNRISNK